MRPRNASPILNRKMKPSTAAAMARPLRRKKLIKGPATVAASQAAARPDRPERSRNEAARCARLHHHALPNRPDRSKCEAMPNRRGQVEVRGDPVLVLRLGGDALRRRRLAHEREADVAEDDHAPEHQEGGLPVVLDPGVLEGLRRLQRERPAELVSRPPAHDRDGRPRGHGFPLRGADLLDPQRVDGDVLGRGGDGDDQADGDHAGQGSPSDRSCSTAPGTPGSPLAG